MESSPVQATLPWSSRDVARVTWMVGLGALGCGVAWYGASGEASDGDQLPWLTLGVAAAAFTAVGLAAWLLAALRQVRRAARGTAAVVAWEHERHLPVPDAVDAPLESGYWVSAPTMTRYHAAGCQLVHGKPEVEVVNMEGVSQRRLRPCGVCLHV